MSSYLILDKSFLRAESKEKILELNSKYQILVPEALLYELLKDSSEKRAHLCQKLSDYHFIRDSNILGDEIRLRKPYGKPSLNIKVIDYSSHKEFCDPKYELDENQKSLVKYKEKTIRLVTKVFINQPAYTNLDIKCYESLLDKIIHDKEYILSQYRQLQLHKNIFKDCSKPVIDESWAIFKWLQITSLFQLDTAYRYQNPNIIRQSKNAQQKQIHDTLDQFYLLLAVLEGSFATKEKKLIEFFDLLCPTGSCIK